MNTFTVPLFLLALIIGLAPMALDIYQVNACNVGTVKLSPWARHASAWLGSATSWLMKLSRFLRSREALACAALLVLLVSPAAAAGLGLVGMAGIVGEPTLAEVKTAIEASNRIFEQFKEANDARIKAIEAGRAVDPLITEKLDKLNAEMDKRSGVIETFQALEARFNRLEKLSAEGDKPEARVKELKSFNNSLKALAIASGRSTPAELTQDDLAAYKAAEEVYLRRGDRNLTDAERKSLSVGVDPSGGYLVTPDRSGRMIERIFETSPMRQYASVQPISTDALEGTYDIDEASVGWVAETGTRSNSNTPNVPLPWRIPVHEIYTQPTATQKLLEDANIDVAQWLGKKSGDKIGRTANTAFVTGTGVGKPRGFASYTTAATADTSRAWGVLEHVKTGTNGGFGTDPNGANKLLDVIHAMKDVYAARAAFYMNRTTLGAARKLMDGNGAGAHYLFVPAFNASMPDTFMGYPVRKLQDMADYTTTDALAIAFGDMEETYQIVDRLGVTVLVDPYTNKPYVNFYTRARVGGDVLNFESLKFLKFSA